MAALNFQEIAEARSGSLRDEFEVFAREFLVREGFKVISGPDRGPDGGRDLIVEEVRSGPGGQTYVRWLVSCKHKAHGGGSVTQSEEADIRDRLETHACDGFLAFYSTLPSSGLAAKLTELSGKYGSLVYDSGLIERRLLDSPWGRMLAARYFPVSFNTWIQKSQFVLNAPKSDPQMIRNKFFLREPHSDFEEGLAEVEARKLLAFVVIYDPKHPSLSKLDYALGYFMEFQTTKRLVDQHFVPILGPSDDPAFAALVPEDDPLEICLWVVLDAQRNVLRREAVYANYNEGLKRIRSVIGQHVAQKKESHA